MARKARVVDVFATPYEVWTQRATTEGEALELMKQGVQPLLALQTKDKLVEKISTPGEAAARILRECVDNGLEGHVDSALMESSEYSDLRGLMPKNVPKALDSYQSEYDERQLPTADEAIRAHGIAMAEGQFLFHGGLWPSNTSVVTTSRPLSTSFCPQVALRNAEWKGKAYDAGRVDLMVVRVGPSETPAYAYSREGSHGNEKEVVFASGAKLTRVSEVHITDLEVWKVNADLEQASRVVPAYLVEVELS